MKRILLTCWLACLCAFSLSAQTGSYFLTHHSPGEENFDNICFDMEQDHHGIMYFAMKAGILEFDGREWDLIPGAGAIYTLTRDSTGQIFWAGARGFGTVGYDRKGSKQIQYLSDSLVKDVFQSLAVGNHIYFLSEGSVYRYDARKSKAEVLVSGNGQGIFTGMFELFGVVYVQTERNTTFKVESNKLVFADLNFSGHVLFSSKKGDAYIFGTSDNRVHTCRRDLVMHEVPVIDQPYADANVVVAGAWVDDDLLALGTLRGGVMLLNPHTGERDQIIDYSTGLPDNEVFSLMADASQNIWVAHEYGFTQISPSLPFRSFSYYDGLEGNMLCAYSYDQAVYVGTSLGLFKLHKEELYDEFVTYVDVAASTVPGRSTAGPGQPLADTRPPDVEEQTPSRKRGLFGFLRRNRDKDKADEIAQNEPPPSNTTDAAAQLPARERRVQRVLRSSQHVFKRVAGISAKITHLVESDGRLIAAGLEGVFEVRDLAALPILSSPTRHIHAAGESHSVVASTYNDEIWLLTPGQEWKQTNVVNGLGDQIDFLFDGSANEWWFCGLDRIYRLEMNGADIGRLQTIPLTNPNFEKTVGVYFNENIVLVNADGFFRFDRQSAKLTRIDTLPAPAQYFAFDGHILYRDEHRWHVFGAAEETSNLQLLNLFQNLRFIATDQKSQNLWLISGTNELLKFEGENITLIPNRFPIFLKSVQNNSVTLADLSHIEIDQNNSSVTFEVVQPDYINPRSIEFRYMLEGMHQDWTDWSSANNKINFPYLPTGEYRLRVQARNIFGKISELEAVPFEVIPPYWKQSWFYALEFMVFASLVILSFRLSTRYRIISRFLSLVTIILLIEFIQTVVGSSIVTSDSPVIEFLIQFFVAILILPVEGFLRNLMLRSLDSSSRFYSFINPGSKATLAGDKGGQKRKVRETI